MKIAVITDDEQTISQHFGRAPYYLVFTVENGQIVGKALRSKLGHRQFASEPHDHHEDHHDEHGPDPRGHGFGPHADRRHARMAEAIADCEVLIVRGMGRGAYLAMQQANITPVVTDIVEAEAAVKAYLEGSLVDHVDKLH